VLLLPLDLCRKQTQTLPCGQHQHRTRETSERHPSGCRSGHQSLWSRRHPTAFGDPRVGAKTGFVQCILTRTTEISESRSKR
jgi:hypothetical protein